MTKNPKLILFSLLAGIILASCTPMVPVQAENDSNLVPINEKDIDEPQTTTDDNLRIETPQAVSEVILPEEKESIELPELKDLQSIDTENAVDLQELAAVRPYYPPYTQISADGRMGAVGDLGGIDIFLVSSGELVDHFPVELPVSDFGIERYFQFNYDGSFLAAASKNEIQVWQVGGGLIYTAPYSRQFNTTASVFGADIPQLALSPDGRLLVVSAVDFSSPAAKQYFRVIDVLNNEIIYEWDGRDETLHGNLYGYPGLGFSQDGSVLQTFDPSRYAPLSGTAFEAFRFWSTKDSLELDPSSDNVRNAFSSSDLLFALQTEAALEIQDRTNGARQYSLTGTGCSFEFPCDVKISGNGKYAAIVDYSEETLSYRRDLIAQEFQVWDLESEGSIGKFPLNARNLDGVQVDENGSYQIVQIGSAQDVAESIWWTSTNNFAGLTMLADRIIFSPTKVGLDEPGCHFCGTCELILDSMQIICAQQHIAQEGNTYHLNNGEAAQNAGLSSGIGQVDLPVGNNPGLTVRILGISTEWQKVFYCLDQDQRQQACSIYDLEDEAILADFEDIFVLRFSADGDYAAFINRDEKALFVIDLETGKVNRISAYQSRAWPVNPAFDTNSTELVYMIQNINSLDVLSLEWVNAEDKRVLRRINLENGLVGEPSALAWEPESGLVAVSNKDGWIYLLEQEKGKLLHSWQAETEEIIGILFSEDGKLLITMGKTGIIRFWGVSM